MSPIQLALLYVLQSSSAVPQSFLWSSPATWGGSIPQAGDAITIPAGMAVTLDTTTANLSNLQINGDLIVSAAVDSWLKTQSVTIGATGRYLSGTPSIPNTRTHRRTMTGAMPTISGNVGGGALVRGFTHDPTTGNPTGNNASTNDYQGIYRGLRVMNGGQYLIYAARPALLKTKIQGNHVAGATTLTLVNAVFWKAGQDIVIYPTDFYDPLKRAERRTIAADTNGANVVTLTAGIGYDRYGRLQYPDDDKTIHLDTPGTFTSGVGGMRATANVPNVIDQRARVMLLTRTHIVEGDNDSAWTTDGFGAHEMYMGINSRIVVKGVEYRRCGQSGLLGRYPIHFHVPAYNADGTTTSNAATGLSDGYFAPGQAVIEDCAVNESMNRLCSLHACRGVKFQNNVGFDIKGHAYFFEDNSEIGNIMIDNDVAKVSVPATGRLLKGHDSAASGWWFANGAQSFLTLTGDQNGAADCDGNGAWYAITEHARVPTKAGGCFGFSSNVPIFPEYTALNLDYSGFNLQSNLIFGMEAMFGAIDEHGHLDGQSPKQFVNGVFSTNQADERGQIFVGDFIWKNNTGGYRNLQFNPKYRRRKMIDNKLLDFTGSTRFGEIEECLFVSQSNNNASGDPGWRLGMVGYHGTVIARNNSVFGYTANGVPSIQTVYSTRTHLFMKSAWISYHDTYLEPFFSYSKSQVNNRSTGKLQMYIGPSSWLHDQAPFTTWTGGVPCNRDGYTAQSFYDADGSLFGVGAGVYATNDWSFMTYGAGTLIDIKSDDGLYIGMKGITTPMYGIQRDPSQMWGGRKTGTVAGELNVQSQPNAWKRVDPTTLADAAGVAIWNTHNSTSPTSGGYDFQCVLPEGGAVRLYDPVTPSQTYDFYALLFFKAFNPGTDQNLIVGIPWADADTFLINGANYNSASKAAMLASTATLASWRDTTNHVAWFKFNFKNVSSEDLDFTVPSSGVLYHGLRWFPQALQFSKV